MKKSFALYSLLMLLKISFADIPYPNEEIIDTTNNFNYLPLALGITFAAGILAFIYTLKKDKNANK